MDKPEMMHKIEAVLEDAKAGILATVDAAGRPHARWMTPFVLTPWPENLFAVTSPEFPKIQQLEQQTRVEWMLQTRSLDQIINIRGVIRIVDNPSLKAQIIEAIGKKLTVFWTVNKGKTDFVVLETIIEEAGWYSPVKGLREVVSFLPAGGSQ